MTTINYSESFEELRSNKPTFPITSPSKLVIGLLVIILAISLVFVLTEERQRGIALFIMIPFGLCVSYFLYLWFRDNQAIKAYKLYLTNIRNMIRKANPNYKFESSRPAIYQTLSEQKNIAGILAVLMLFGTIILQAQASRLSSLFAVLFVIMIISFVYLNEYESKMIEEEISCIEKKMPKIKEYEESTTQYREISEVD